jgi:hypothetical protein
MKHVATSPFIIIGMHRSGTSMISRILEDMGLFSGMKKQHDHEAVFFINLNEWLLRQAGGSWDNPEAIRYFLQHKEARAMAAEYIRFIMATPRVTSFLGWKNYFRYRSPENLDFSWGWKDPRTTFTLPLWLDIFPDAKIIHIYRNGIDVADSLRVREGRDFAKIRHPIHNSMKRLLYVLRPKRGGFAVSPRCAVLEGGFSLWEEYLAEARRHVKNMGDRALEIKYEDFLSDPRSSLKTLLNFCNLPIESAAIERALEQVKKSRAYAFRENEELMSFCRKMRERLSLYGY